MFKRIIIVGAAVAITVAVSLRADVVTSLGGGTIPNPLPQVMGGTGTGALPCAAGAFVTSNGTVYSCAIPGGLSLIGYGVINADGTIAVQYGVAVGSTGHTTGRYTITVPGMAVATGIVTTTPWDTAGDGSGRASQATPGTGSFGVHMKTTADGDVDSKFSYAIFHL